ncbi:hypothetical protein [Solidesulfovibrio sp.]|uniref:hypothetical protein n=1 Tax=Solidesulfovibrio sp. TaxID=2910990 RepID=UPI002B209A12|nr:hypothetical protein [Solidesulfovibrio sp.]MEA4856067.1 hypothetical protein [Solidesulfovibrio sp.]
MEGIDAIIADFEREAPAIVPRSELKKHGWPWSDGHMANIASLRQGPPVFRAGARAVYRREDLVAFLREKLQPAGGCHV